MRPKLKTTVLFILGVFIVKIAIADQLRTTQKTRVFPTEYNQVK